jgi:hypothetical protein
MVLPRLCNFGSSVIIFFVQIHQDLRDNFANLVVDPAVTFGELICQKRMAIPRLYSGSANLIPDPHRKRGIDLSNLDYKHGAMSGVRHSL